MSYDRNAVLNVARGELGYREKASNANLDDKTANAGSGNFTKYARDLDALGYFYNGPKQGFAYCDVGVDWCFVKAYGVEAALELLCQPKYSAGAGCYYSAQYFKQRGQFLSQYTVPQPGDQIFFTYSAGDVSHTGIVESVYGDLISVIEFNTSDQVARRAYAVGSAEIYGYGRPNWGTSTESQQTKSMTDDDKITALAHEVLAGKWGVGDERVALLTAAGYDYNEVQTRVNEIFIGKITTPKASQPEELHEYTVGGSIEQTIFNFCKEVLGLNTAATCGVLANIDEESKFKTGAVGDAGMSYGICQWYDTRCRSLREWCSQNGKDHTTLDGQLWYMKHELETTHATVLRKLLDCADTAEGAEIAGYVWCSIFEVPADTIAKSNARGSLARFTYWPKYAGQTQPAVADTDAKTCQITFTQLSVGMSSTSVERVQTLLIARGYKCGGVTDPRTGAEIPDGEFGPTTEKAVVDFQTANGITADGIVGAATMTALLK